MKRFASVLLVCCLAASLAPGSSAASERGRARTPPPVTGFRDALSRALHRGRLNEAEYALERARSLFELSSVRKRFGEVRRPAPRAATPILRDLLVRVEDLSGRDRRRALSVLARPTDGSSDPEGTGYRAQEATPACSPRVCIHFVATTADAPDAIDDDANGVPDYIDQVLLTFEEVWEAEVVEMGYRAPKSDGNSRNDGGDARLDIYVADVGADGIYGYCTSDDPRAFSSSYPYYDASAYCVVDDDYSAAQFRDGAIGVEALRVTSAHEFFHAIQFAYDAFEDAWFQEGTAVWMEDEVYDDIDDNRAYLDEGPLAAPHVPLDSFFSPFDPNALFAYGTWIFFRHVAETHGRDAIRDMWVRADGARNGENQYSARAIATTMTWLGSSGADEFVAYGADNISPEHHYEEGEAYPEPPRARSHQLDDAASVSGILRLDHLSLRYVSLTPGPSVTPEEVATVRVNAPSIAGARAAMVLTSETGATRVPIPLDGDGTGAATVEFGGVDEAVLVLSNGSTRFRNCFRSLTRFSCGGGIPVDDDLGYGYSAQIGTAAPEPPDPGDGGGDVTPPRLSRVKVAPNPFSPNGDGRRERTTIRWSVNEGADTSVAVFKRRGRRVVTLGRAFTEPGRWFIRWGGRNKRGRRVKAGRYVFKIVAIDAAGNRRTARGTVRVKR